MKNLIQKFKSSTINLLNSRNFLWFSMTIFFLEALWIAFSGRFSMPFDESTHRDAIKLYSTRLLPFWSENPEGVGNLGAVARDPSYLYLYLLSFPFRFFAHFIESEMAQIIFLRLFSIAIFAVGIYIFSKLIYRVTSSRPISNFVILALVLTPYVPFLAAQINYDNAIFPLSGLIMLLLLKITDEIKSSKQLDFRLIGIFMIVGILGSLVKYPFLLLFGATFLCLMWSILSFRTSLGKDKFRIQVKKSLGSISAGSKFLIVTLLVLSSGLFIERYGVNLARYHSPTPECNQVLSIEQCKSYGPWARNYEARQDKLNGSPAYGYSDPINYTVKHWLRIMFYQLFFAYNGSLDHFEIGAPLILPFALGMLLTAVGVILVLVYQKQLRRQFNLGMLLFIVLLYVFGLWAQVYLDFRNLGLPVAIQARYLMPILPIAYMLIALAYSQVFRKFQGMKILLASVFVFIMLFQGGGASVFIVRSNVNWWWQNEAIINVNKKAQRILKKVIIGA